MTIHHLPATSRRENIGKEIPATPVSNRLPVSVKYYARLKARVDSVFASLRLDSGDCAALTMSIIDRYLSTGKYELGAGSRPESLVVFLSLKDEIDTAMERSRRARERAAKRRDAMKTAGEVDKPMEGTPPMPPSKADATHSRPKTSHEKTRFNLRRKHVGRSRRSSRPYPRRD